MFYPNNLWAKSLIPAYTTSPKVYFIKDPLGILWPHWLLPVHLPTCSVLSHLQNHQLFLCPISLSTLCNLSLHLFTTKHEQSPWKKGCQSLCSLPSHSSVTTIFWGLFSVFLLSHGIIQHYWLLPYWMTRPSFLCHTSPPLFSSNLVVSLCPLSNWFTF